MKKYFKRKKKKCLEGCVFIRDGIADCVADGVCPLRVLKDDDG
jgi:hypothetical protein